MADINASLKEALNGKAPQHKKKGQSTFEFSEGTDGALHTKVTDENGIPIDPRKVEVMNQSEFPSDYPDSAVKAELQEIKQQQADILARLDNPIDTQLTGSNVEDGEAIPVSPLAYAKGEVVFESIEVAGGSTLSTPGLDVDFNHYTTYVRGLTGSHDFEVTISFMADVYNPSSVYVETEPLPTVVGNINHTTGEARWEPYTSRMRWNITNNTSEAQEYVVVIWRFR